VFFAAAIFPADATRVEGETHGFRGRHFCPTCGSSVFARYADEIDVHLGALDEPNKFAPTYENWTVRRESWLPTFALNHHYERDGETRDRFDQSELDPEKLDLNDRPLSGVSKIVANVRDWGRNWRSGFARGHAYNSRSRSGQDFKMYD
jgi:hypothetical protein